MSRIKFVDLPDKRANNSKVPPVFWDELDANVGRWAEWPNSSRSVHYAATAHSKNGHEYQARVYQGKGYIRAVSQ